MAPGILVGCTALALLWASEAEAADRWICVEEAVSAQRRIGKNWTLEPQRRRPPSTFVIEPSLPADWNAVTVRKVFKIKDLAGGDGLCGSATESHWSCSTPITKITFYPRSEQFHAVHLLDTGGDFDEAYFGIGKCKRF